MLMKVMMVNNHLCLDAMSVMGLKNRGSMENLTKKNSF